jgi:ribosomal protein S18 acetylase RimI-like enzyme
VAVELVTETLANPQSGYYFIFAEIDGEVAGYICYGDIPVTVDNYEIYWLAALKSQQGRGIGRMLLQAAEQAIASRNGRQIYIHTSGMEFYAPTRAFYLKNGYTQVAELTDYYMPGDSAVIYRKIVR